MDVDLDMDIRMYSRRFYELSKSDASRPFCWMGIACNHMALRQGRCREIFRTGRYKWQGVQQGPKSEKCPR